MAYSIIYKYQNNSEAYEDTEVFNVNFSDKSLTGSTYYKKKPQKVSFESFSNSFYGLLISDTGAYKNISNYTIEVYYDSAIKFSGVIDLALLNYDAKNHIYSITAYDNMYLLKQFTDIDLELNDDEGVAPLIALYNYITEINKRIPWDISMDFDGYTFRQHAIETSFINKFDSEDFFTRLKDSKPAPGSLYLHDVDSPSYVSRGSTHWVSLPEYSMQPQLLIIGILRSAVILAEAQGDYDQYDTISQYNVKAEIWQYYNVCGWQEREDLRQDWEYQEDFGYHTNSPQERAILKYNAILGSYNATSNAYPIISNGDIFVWWMLPETHDDVIIGNIGGEVKISNNLKARKLIPDYTISDDSTAKKYNGLNFLNAALLYYDASLFCDTSGKIILANKYPDIGIPKVLSREDIIEHRVSKVLTYDVELNELDALKGNQTANKCLHRVANLETQATIYQLDLILFDDNNNLGINSTITDPITANDYVIISIKPDEITKESIIKAWRV